MVKQLIKKIIKTTLEEGVEFVKDSASQVGKAISPVEMLKQATGTQHSEITDYLRNLSDKDLTPQQLEMKKKEQLLKDEEEAKKLRLFLNSTPDHLRPSPKQQPIRAHEATIQDEERKKAHAVEAQKKQAQQSVGMPVSKQTRGMLGAKRKPKSSDFEVGKNIKIG